MKILFVHHRYHTNLHNWFRGFKKNGHEVGLLVYKKDEIDLRDLPKSTYLEPSRLSKWQSNRNKRMRGDGVDSFSPYYFPSFKKLFLYFRKEKPKLIVIRPVFTIFGYQLLVLALLFRARIVFHSRISIHRYYPSIKQALFKSILSVLNAFWVSPCKGEPKVYPLASKRLIYFPFVIEPMVDNRAYFENDKVNILCVAKYFSSKNPLMMLNAFIHMREDHKDIRLTICGTGDANGDYYKKMNELVISSGLSDDIDLLINQPIDKVRELYISHDVFVLPTNHDPASFTVLEAMSYGLVAATTNVDGSSGYISSGKNGFVFQKGNIDELILNLTKLIEDRQTISEQGRKSLEMTYVNHDPASITNNFLKEVLA